MKNCKPFSFYSERNSLIAKQKSFSFAYKASLSTHRSIVIALNIICVQLSLLLTLYLKLCFTKWLLYTINQVSNTKWLLYTIGKTKFQIQEKKLFVPVKMLVSLIYTIIFYKFGFTKFYHILNLFFNLN